MSESADVGTHASVVEPRDGRPRGWSAMEAEVLEGMRRPQKEISPKYFYDARGSRLFEDITELPEYYLTRTETALLERWIPEWFAGIRPSSLVELGAGSSRKTRILLDSMEGLGSGSLFVPVDLSEEFLEESADRLRAEYPHLEIVPTVADLNGPLRLSAELPRPAVLALLGSTLGNFATESAVCLLARVRSVMEKGDAFLLGADLRPGPTKSVAMLEAAYNDSRGVTARFNLNALRVLNAQFGSNFDPSAFEHRAFYDRLQGWIEMHLVARRAQTVRFGGGEHVTLREGESIRTEISAKYDRATLDELLARAGLTITRWQEDEEGRYAVLAAERI